jgi:uncharacterized protein (UPF0332 family)
MKPETADCLTKARECLGGAEQIAGLPLPQVAAREAYLAAFHAAEAYIFEQTGRTVKTHRGLRTTFSRLTRNEPRVAPEYLAFLPEPTNLNRFADYSVSPSVRPITADDAARAIETTEDLSTPSPNCCRPVWPRSSAAQP